MKTPEEIMRGLECCTCIDDRDTCPECPYNGPYKKATCITAMTADALAYIRELEARVAEYEKPLRPLTLCRWCMGSGKSNVASRDAQTVALDIGCRMEDQMR